MRRYIRSITQFPTWLIAGLIAYVPFHAFASVWLSSFFGHYTLLRLLPEFVLAVLAVWAVVRLCRSAALRQKTIGTVLGRVILGYLAIIVLLSIVAYFRETASAQAFWYGVLLTARPVVWLAVVWVFALEHSWLRDNWQRFVLVPLAVVAGFAVLQFFVLPADFLSHFGYEKGITIPPGQTLNQDTDTIRAQSTLRGPNPLGAYLAVGVALLATMVVPKWRKGGLGLLLLSALFLSFSRSAWLGLAVALVVFAWLALSSAYRKRALIVGGIVLIVLLGSFWLFRDNPAVQNVVFHSTDTSTAVETSNEAHAVALRASIDDVLSEPLGRGPGTAGPASIYNEYAQARNSESYFLNIGQEYGWLGLGVFVALLTVLGLWLYRARSRLGYVVLATLVGSFVINMFAYAWADTTLVYLWWGLAGIAVASVTSFNFDARLRAIMLPLRRLYARAKPSKKGVQQFAYYNLGGIAFFVTGYLVFVVLYGLLGWHWLIAKAIADLTGWAVNYLVQHYVAFRDTARSQGHRKTLKKFVPFSLLNVPIDYAIVGGLNWLGVTPFIGLWVSSLFFTAWKWLWYKHWVFKPNRHP